MSLEILEKVKDFIIKLVKDEDFRTQFMSEQVESVGKLLQDRGYNFSQEEFETAAIKILELKDIGQFDELSEAELVATVGGLVSITPDSPIQAMYGVIVQPPEDYITPIIPKPILKPRPRPLPKPWPQPQPMYGIIIQESPLTDS